MQNVKVKGRQTDEQTDGRTDGADYVTCLANALDNNVGGPQASINDDLRESTLPADGDGDLYFERGSVAKQRCYGCHQRLFEI